MLTTTLDRLTGLVSKHFIIGAFVPILVFAFVNGFFLAKTSSSFDAWAKSQTSGSGRVFDVAAFFILLAVLAYVLWSLNGFLRQVLEGRHLPRAMEMRLRARQIDNLRTLENDYYKARDTTRNLARKQAEWSSRLRAAAEKGQNGQNTYNRATSPAAQALQNLKTAQAVIGGPSLADLERAVTLMEGELARNDVRAGSTPAQESELSEDRLDLLAILDYAEEEWTAKEVDFATKLQTRYGTGPGAATTLGNVADSLQGYAISRYRLNLATFWSRLQPLLQKQEAFYGVLQDAKTQLDFLVACVWLSALTTMGWVVALPICGSSVALFLTIAILGPLAAWAFYRAAVESYVAFGEIVRTAVDLYRFDLFDALKLVRPRGLRDERALWDALHRIASFGQEWVDLSYCHDRETKV